MTDRFRMLPSYHYEDNTDGNLLKSVGKPLRDYKIEGNCFQDGTPSPDNAIDIQCCGERTVNMIDFAGYLGQALPYTKSQYGMSGIYNKDGSLILSGTSTASHDAVDFYFFDIKYMEPGSYTLSGVSWSDSHDLFGQYYENGERIAKYVNNKTEDSTAIFTIEENQGIYFTIRCSRKFVDVENLIMKPQLQKGNTATPYEPYGYKVPVMVGGKNILPVNDFKGTVNWQSFPVVHIKVEPNTRYYFEAQYAKRLSNSTGALSVYFYDNESLSSPIRTTGLMVAKKNDLNYAHQTSIDTGDYTDLYMMIRDISGGSTTFEVKGMQLTKDYSPPYEPYKEPQTYNIYLDEPLRKVEDYADYLDFKNSKVVKEITAKVKFTGDEDWVIYPNKTKTFQYIPSIGIMLKGICTHYSSIKSSNMDIENGFVMDYVRSFIISDVRYNTVDDFKAFLKSEYENGNPVTFYLKINAKTIETPITLPKILTEKHTNIISVGTTLQPSKVNYQYYKGGK